MLNGLMHIGVAKENIHMQKYVLESLKNLKHIANSRKHTGMHLIYINDLELETIDHK